MRQNSEELRKAVVVKLGGCSGCPDWILVDYKTGGRLEWISTKSSSNPRVGRLLPIKSMKMPNSLIAKNLRTMKSLHKHKRPIQCLKASFLMAGVPHLVWWKNIFSFLTLIEINHFSQTCRSANRLVDESHKSRAQTTSYWSKERVIIAKDFIGPHKLAYEGPYKNEEGTQFYRVHATRTVKFLVKMLNTKETYEVRFRKGRFLWSEDSSTGTRVGSASMKVVEPTWVDCRILKKNFYRSRRHCLQSCAKCVFETTLTTFDGSKISTQFVLCNQDASSHLWSDYLNIGFHTNVSELQTLSIVSEFNLKRYLQCYFLCALRLDASPALKAYQFPTSGSFLSLVPPALFDFVPMETVEMAQTIMAPQPPWAIKKDMYYPPPSRQAYFRLLKQQKTFRTRENRRWREYLLSDVYWLGFY